jgi:hypothetical protein
VVRPMEDFTILLFFFVFYQTFQVQNIRNKQVLHICTENVNVHLLLLQTVDKRVRNRGIHCCISLTPSNSCSHE